MNKSKLTVLVVLAGVFIMNTVSVSADPALLIGKAAEQAYKYLFRQIGKEAAEKAMKKALREAGEKLTYKSLQKIGREAAEKAVIDANAKLARKLIMEGGEKLSSKALNETYQMLEKAAVKTLASEVKNELVREASMEALETGGRRTLGVATERGSIMYLTKDANNILSLTTNQADAILLTPEMIEKYSVYLQKVYQTVRP